MVKMSSLFMLGPVENIAEDYRRYDFLQRIAGDATAIALTLVISLEMCKGEPAGPLVFDGKNVEWKYI